MFALNISCIVCKETFKNSDSIYTTNCGHVFHNVCIHEWLSRSSNCPYCKSYNPEPRRIYFNFNSQDESEDFEKTVNDLKSQLKNSIEKVFDLGTKLKKSEDKVKTLNESVSKKVRTIDGIQRLYNISEQWRAEFQDKIQKLSEENEKLKENLKSKINVETIQVINCEDDDTINHTDEELKQIISKLKAENLKLNEKINESESSKIVLNYKIEMLEQRLKHLNLELKKQITEYINRPISNLSQTETSQNSSNDQEKVVDETKSTTGTLNLNKKKSDNFIRSRNNLKENISNHNEDNLEDNLRETRPSKFGNDKPRTQTAIGRERKFILTNPNDCKVIIKEFPRRELMQPLKNAIIMLANKMSISMTSDDILNVSAIDKNGLSNIAILVEFKTIDTKIKFLSNRNRLKSYASTKSIQIKEYIDETIYPIFMYANRNLRSNGYEYICCKNNQVFAKKSINDTTEIVIKTKNDVEQLLGRTFARDTMVRRYTRLGPKRTNRISIRHLPSYEDEFNFNLSLLNNDYLADNDND